MEQLSSDDKAKFERWIIENVDETVVPRDEGNDAALIYNLVHLLRGDKTKWAYKDKQYAELKLWGFEPWWEEE